MWILFKNKEKLKKKKINKLSDTDLSTFLFFSSMI